MSFAIPSSVGKWKQSPAVDSENLSSSSAEGQYCHGKRRLIDYGSYVEGYYHWACC